MTSDAEEYLTTLEVAKRLRVSDDTVRRMIAAKQLEAIRVRRQWRVKKSSLERYEKGQR